MGDVRYGSSADIRPVHVMSALPPITDIRRCQRMNDYPQLGNHECMETSVLQGLIVQGRAHGTAPHVTHLKTVRALAVPKAAKALTGKSCDDPLRGANDFR